MTIYDSLNEESITSALKAGAIGVIPTDTVYGVVAEASNPEAVARVYEAKKRENKPGTLIAANIEQLETLGIKRRYMTPVAQYWPGAVSVVIPCGDELAYLHMGQRSLAVRIPDDDSLLALLQETGPLATSSANLTGQPTATTLKMAQDYFGEAVDFYVEGGDLSGRLPSTIIRVVDDEIEVLRQGAVTIKEG
jgi:L-threonylcarbamoyladenylate synthase